MDGTFPPADVPIEDITFADLSASEEELRYKALISWKQKTKSGRVSAQYRYTQAFHQRNAEEKFRRVEAIEPHIGNIAKELTRRMSDGDLQPTQREGAAIASLLLETGLRPTDSSESVKHGHFGAASLQVQHLLFAGNEVHLDFIGKEGIRNQSVVREPNMVEYLRSAVQGKQPGDFVFSQANSNHAIQTLKESSQAVGGPADILLKDLRTLKATKTAEAVVDTFNGPPPPLTGNEKKDTKLLASAILAMSGEVSKVLNNKPAMARDNYIHPRVWRRWQSKLASVN
jgi:DNA topoisomerase-1